MEKTLEQMHEELLALLEKHSDASQTRELLSARVAWMEERLASVEFLERKAREMKSNFEPAFAETLEEAARALMRGEHRKAH